MGSGFVEECQEVGACGHCVDNDVAVVVGDDDDEFSQVAGGVWADEGEPGWVFVGVVIELDECMFVSVGDVVIP